MNPRTTARLAWGITTLGLLLLVSGWVFAYLGRTAPTAWEDSTWQGRIIGSIPAVFALVLGGLLAARLPGNLYGWMWLSLGFGWGGLLVVGQNYAIYALMVKTDLPFGWAAETLAAQGWFLGLAMLPLVLLLYPTGKPPSPRWRFLVWIILASLLLGLSIGWAMPGESGFVPLEKPHQVQGQLAVVIEFLANIAIYTLFIMVLPCALSLFLRFRRAAGVERAQLKWFAYGAVVFVVGLASDFLYTFPGVWENFKESIAFSILPVAVGIAILRYRLYDIDIIIRRTLQYTLLTGLIALVYFGSVVLLQSLLENLTGQQSPVAIVVSTLVIAALFNPLRRRVQDFIDRRFYRKKYNAEQALAQFAITARDEVDMDKLTAALLGVVEETMRPEQLSLMLVSTTARAADQA